MDKAQEIRTMIARELKLTRRDVSVVRDGISLYVTIKTVKGWYSRADVERIAKGFESVRKCQVSGDYLEGGNTFIEVKVSREVKVAVGAPYLEFIQMLVPTVMTMPEGKFRSSGFLQFKVARAVSYKDMLHVICGQDEFAVYFQDYKEMAYLMACAPEIDGFNPKVSAPMTDMTINPSSTTNQATANDESH